MKLKIFCIKYSRLCMRYRLYFLGFFSGAFLCILSAGGCSCPYSDDIRLDRSSRYEGVRPGENRIPRNWTADRKSPHERNAFDRLTDESNRNFLKKNNMDKPSDLELTDGQKGILRKLFVGEYGYNLTAKHIGANHMKDNEGQGSNAGELELPDNHQKYKYNLRSTNIQFIGYIINGHNICNSANIDLLVYVLSTPNHVAWRNLVRNTWADKRLYTSMSIAVVFVLAKSENLAIQAEVFKENLKYGDILQFDYPESYTNVTYKCLGTLRWIQTMCSHARYVLKVDEDCVINIWELQQLLSDRTPLQNTSALSSLNDSIICDVHQPTVYRKGKWKVSKQEYPGDQFPIYCSGLAYLMSTNVASKLYQASDKVQFLWIEDVFITGILSNKTNVSLVSISKRYTFLPKQVFYLLDRPYLINQFLFFHVYDINYFLTMWTKVKLVNKATV